MALPKIPELKELMEAGVHFGHASAKWHPKMAPYIFATRDKLHILNLEKTREQLEKVLPILEERVASGKGFILVGTKRQVADMVKDMGERLSINYVNERWLGGTMTNFGQIVQSIARMKRIEETLADEEAAAKILKKERVMMQADLRRMHMKFSGLRNFTKKPDFMIVIDPSHEHNAIKEAQFEGIEVFALVDTNTDPSDAHYVIPTNDDGPKALKLMLGLIEETIKSGLEKAAASKAQSEAAKEKEKEEAADIKVAEPAAEELEEIEEKIEEQVSKETKETKSAKPKKEDKDAKIEEASAKED